MVNIFVDQHPGQQAYRRHAPVNDCGRNWGSRDGFTVFAGVLGTDVAMYRKDGWSDIQLFGDVFTDFDQFTAASGTLAGVRFMAKLDARQMVRQALAACTWPPGHFVFTGLAARQFIELRFDSRHILIPGIGKQILLQLAKRLTFDTVSSPAQVGELVSQGLYFVVLVLDFCLVGLKQSGIFFRLFEQRLDDVRQLGFSGGFKVKMLGSKGRFHGVILPWNKS